MFNIGGGELIVILLLALIVLGPQRLPDAARQIGKTLGDLRRLSTGFQNEMRSALDVADDPTHVSGRRDVLAKEEPSGPVTDGAPADGAAAPVSEAVAAVSGRRPAGTTSKPAARSAKVTATAKAAPKKAAPKKAAPKKAAPKKVAPKKAPPKSGAAASPKATARKAAPRRTDRG